MWKAETYDDRDVVLVENASREVRKGYEGSEDLRRVSDSTEFQEGSAL